MKKGKGTAKYHGNRQSWFGILPKDPGWQRTERRHLIQEEVLAGVEEERVSRTVGLRQKGVWVMGKYSAVQDYLVKYHSGIFPLHPIPCPSCVLCPTKLSKPAHLG